MIHYYVIRESNDELCHHGILGQKWGVRRYQNKDGTLTKEGRLRYNVNSVKDINNINRTYSKYNTDKWGKTKSTNILWVTGLSGSGKSTVANSLAKGHNADVVNMDLYLYTTPGTKTNHMSKSFNKYLDKNVPNWKHLQEDSYRVLRKVDRRNEELKAAGKWFDTFQDALENYGKDMYGKQKIIAEGVQILDDTLFYNNKKALKSQPVIIMNTSMEESIASRILRDNKTFDKLLKSGSIEQAYVFDNGRRIIEEILKENE